MSDQAHWFAIEALPEIDLPVGTHTGLAVGTHTEALTLLNTHGFSPLDVHGLAAQRLALGAYHQIAWTGSRTTDLLLVNGDRYRLAHAHPDADLYDMDTGPLLAGFHNDGNEIPIDEDALLDTINIPSNNFEIPVNELHDHPVAQFLLGDLTKDYQQWLADIHITHLPFMLPTVALARHYPHPFMRPLIMRCTDNWSGIITANADLHTAYGYRATSNTYTGPVQPPETFTVHALAPVADLFDLPARPHTLNELCTAAEHAGRTDVLGTALRLVRGNSDLPASHNTWAPGDSQSEPGEGPG